MRALAQGLMCGIGKRNARTVRASKAAFGTSRKSGLNCRNCIPNSQRHMTMVWGGIHDVLPSQDARHQGSVRSSVSRSWD